MYIYIPHERTAARVDFILGGLSDGMHWIKMSISSSRMWFASKWRQSTLRFSSPWWLGWCFLKFLSCMITMYCFCWHFDEGKTVCWFTEWPWSSVHCLYQLIYWWVCLLFLTSYTQYTFNLLILISGCLLLVINESVHILQCFWTNQCTFSQLLYY